MGNGYQEERLSATPARRVFCTHSICKVFAWSFDSKETAIIPPNPHEPDPGTSCFLPDCNCTWIGGLTAADGDDGDLDDDSGELAANGETPCAARSSITSVETRRVGGLPGRSSSLTAKRPGVTFRLPSRS